MKKIQNRLRLSALSLAAVMLLSGCGMLSFGVQYPTSKQEVVKPVEPFIGAYLDGGNQSVASFENLTRTKLNSLLIFRSFGKNQVFNPGESEMLKKTGVMPMIGWEPWDPAHKKNLKDYSLQHIVDGDYDSIIENWAQTLHEFGAPIMLRFAHEMNGAWYPWGVEVSGNTPELYIQAWRRVHDIFTSLGADNVVWVWSPNIVRPSSKYRLAQFYPGDDYVDLMGLVGYGANKVDTFDTVFGESLAQLRAISSKKIILTETAASANLKDRAGWMKTFFAELAKDKQICGFMWFQADKRQPWSLKTAGDAAAFSNGVAKYKKDWSDLVGGKQ